MSIVHNRPDTLKLAKALGAVGLPPATWHRRVHPPPARPKRTPAPAKPQPRALDPAEREQALDLMRSPDFVDKAPAQIVHTLLDEGRYLCSERTLYRILASANELKERRRIKRHNPHAKPELLATAPNQVWSWDITRLKGPEKWSYFYLYVILDIFSRYLIAWTVEQTECSSLFKPLMLSAVLHQEIHRDQLTLHADRGGPMKSKATSQLLADLGVARSHSRPHTSDDNPFIESHFKTTKHHPAFPERFENIEQARAFMATFVHWYNHEHRHSGIAYLTPHQLHHGLGAQTIAARQTTLDTAFLAHPERFAKPPVHPPVPSQTWINPPQLIHPNPPKEAPLSSLKA